MQLVKTRPETHKLFSYTLTLLFCVTADVANKIAQSNEHMQTLVRCCKASGHEGVKSEACRMLALIAKQAKTAGKFSLNGTAKPHFPFTDNHPS